MHFIIWTAGWNEAVGGSIALHTLCDRLNRAGTPAALWPDYKPLPGRGSWARRIIYALRGKRRFARGPFANPIARTRDLADAVVVYPEIVAGNPLGARRVVRWFLHLPGNHTGRIDYGADDLFFFYAPAFDDPAINHSPDNLLRITYVNPVYAQTNFGARTGACYLVRKGADRILDRHPPDAILIDDLSHEEKAAVFNRTQRLYSYDSYTMYSLYAALCGCTPIVVPVDGVSLTQWWPGERSPGIAYGEDDIAYALETRPGLLERVAKDVEDEDRLVARFIALCRSRFGSAPTGY